MYDGVIFDKDGVLLDSALNGFRWLDRIRIKEARTRDIDFSRKDSVRVAKGTQESVEEVVESHDIDFEELMDIEKSVQEAKNDMIREGYIRLFPGAADVLKQVEVSAVATNAPKKSAEFALDFFSIGHFFDDVRSVELREGRWVKRRKPKPVMLEEIREELGLEKPVMVGDSASDVEAAERAGIDSILVESYRSLPDLNPDYRVKDLAEVLRIL